METSFCDREELCEQDAECSFQFDCKQMCKSASDGDRLRTQFFSVTHLGVVLCPILHLYKEGVLSDIFVIWDGATPGFESSDQIAEGIIISNRLS